MASKYQQINYLKQQFLNGETIKWDHSFHLLLSLGNMNDFITDNKLLHSPWSVQVDLIIFHTTKCVVLLIICNIYNWTLLPGTWLGAARAGPGLAPSLSISISVPFPVPVPPSVTVPISSVPVSRPRPTLPRGRWFASEPGSSTSPVATPSPSCQTQLPVIFNWISSLDNYYSTWKSLKQIIVKSKNNKTILQLTRNIAKGFLTFLYSRDCWKKYII